MSVAVRLRALAVFVRTSAMSAEACKSTVTLAALEGLCGAVHLVAIWRTNSAPMAEGETL